MNLLTVKLLFCILALLIASAAILTHNLDTATATARQMREAQAQAFDGGSVRRSLQHYVPR